MPFELSVASIGIPNDRHDDIFIFIEDEISLSCTEEEIRKKIGTTSDLS